MWNEKRLTWGKGGDALTTTIARIRLGSVSFLQISEERKTSTVQQSLLLAAWETFQISLYAFCEAPGRAASSSALQESDFSTIVGNAQRTLLVHANPKSVLFALPVSSLYSPSGQSTHSKQHVGSPSIMPFLVPGRQSMLQLEKGTCKKRARRGLTVKYFKYSLPTAGLELTPRV